MGPSGNFEIDGRDFHWDVDHIETYDGDEYAGEDMDDHIHEADRIFYHAASENEKGENEDYYRWLGGPFESWDDVEAAIIDEVEVYA